MNLINVEGPPQIGDVIVKKRFCWMPKNIKGTIRFMSFYYEYHLFATITIRLNKELRELNQFFKIGETWQKEK